MNKRLIEIRNRKEEIRKALQGEGKVDLKALQEELRSLDAEQKEIEEREKIAHDINVGKESSSVHKRQKPEEVAVVHDLDSEEYRKAFMDYVTRGTAIPTEFRDATNTTDAGALIPPVTLNRVVEKIRTYGNILPLVTRTAYASGLAIPTSDVKPVATWVSEGATSTKADKLMYSVSRVTATAQRSLK